MAKCIDCFHHEACSAFSKIINAAVNVETGCEHFKDRTEVVEVVRCEDCKYRVLDTVNGEDWCNHTLGLCSEVYATDYCCHGERKDK